MSRAGIIALSLIAVCYAATTTRRPHTTHEPHEFESVIFSYSGFTQHVLVKQHSGKQFNCYVATLNTAELNQIHTDSGLRTVEIRVLNMLSSATPVDGSSLDDHDMKMCGHGRNGTLPSYFTIDAV